MADNYISVKTDKGILNVSEEVVGSIVRTAVSDVEGVTGLNNAAGAEIAEFIGVRSMSKGVRISHNGENIVCDVIINVCYGSNIIDVAKNVQNSVESELQTITGQENITVNVNVAGIAF